jgi:signal transduction histidine kinase
VAPEAFVDVLQRQRVPPDWVVSVFDAKGMRVARSRAHEQFLGMPAAPGLQQLMAAGAEEGFAITHALEGDVVYTAFSRLPSMRWSVAIGIPPSVVEAGQRRSVLVYGGGIVLSIALGALAALLIARSITIPISQLRAAAQALGRRETPAPPSTRVAEISLVAQSLLAAAEELRRADAERERLLEGAQQARAAAEAASRAKDEFLAMLGHELRNPLAAISNASRLLEHPRADAETERQAREIIGRQVRQLSRLTDDLLDAGRTVTGKIVLQREPVDLAAAAAHALEGLKPRTDGHRIVQELDPAWVDADPMRLEQIISNLLVNAVKYTPAGGAIRVHVKREGGAALLQVADDGIGMSPDLTARAFDLFVQGARGLDRAHGGLGIGLTLVRRLAELHGGSASAYSAGPGQGSEFSVRLPAIPPPASARP